MGLDARTSAFLLLAACSSAPPGAGALPPDLRGAPVPEMGATLKVIGTDKDGLAQPRGLQFAPDHPDELWAVNQRTNGVVIFFDPGTPQQRAEARVDRYAQHFMATVSGLAFGTQNRFATCQESRDPWNDSPQAPDDFMGPTLWLADLDVFASVGQDYPLRAGAPEGSHIDMLHESPLCMGIAHEADNVFWAFDGLNGHVVRYDFVQDHGPGGSNHKDGRVRRYVEATVTRLEETASQLAYDADSGLLYVADTGAGRVTRLDTKSGHVAATKTPPQMESLAEYAQVTDTTYDVFAGGLVRPSGLALHDRRLFVSDAGTGEIVAFDLLGHELGRVSTGARAIMGLTVGPEGKLYFVDRDNNSIVRVDP